MVSPSLMLVLDKFPHGAAAMAVLIGGFGALCWRKWRGCPCETDDVAAAQQAIAEVDRHRSVPHASRMLDALHRARLAPSSEARLQPELARLERALERSASSWDIPRFDSGAELSEFGSALSGLIAKLRVTPLNWLEDPRNRR